MQSMAKRCDQRDRWSPPPFLNIADRGFLNAKAGGKFGGRLLESFPNIPYSLPHFDSETLCFTEFGGLRFVLLHDREHIADFLSAPLVEIL